MLMGYDVLFIIIYYNGYVFRNLYIYIIIYICIISGMYISFKQQLSLANHTHNWVHPMKP